MTNQDSTPQILTLHLAFNLRIKYVFSSKRALDEFLGKHSPVIPFVVGEYKDATPEELQRPAIMRFPRVWLN